MSALEIDPKPAALPEIHRFETFAEGLGRFDILIGLPADYATSTDCYSVIYLTDAPQFFWTLFGIMRFMGMGVMPPAIIVGIGWPEDEGMSGWGARRHYEFTPPWDMTDELGMIVKGAIAAGGTAEGRPNLEVKAGGAERFLGFLRDELAPAIRATYRCDGSKPTLIGESTGAVFVLYALFSEDSPFDKYICTSPPVAAADHALFRMEAEYARTHSDLAARLFLSAGTEEMTQPIMALFEVGSGMARFTELFVKRRYPGLALKSELMSGESHTSIFPRALMHGLLHVYAQPPAAASH